jgi:hypothetical protein
LSFVSEVKCLADGLFGWPGSGLFGWPGKVINHNTAVFRQINKDNMAAHHDALGFPDGQIVLLTALEEGQQATVLQLPAEPKPAAKGEAKKRKRQTVESST